MGSSADDQAQVVSRVCHSIRFFSGKWKGLAGKVATSSFTRQGDARQSSNRYRRPCSLLGVGPISVHGEPGCQGQPFEFKSALENQRAKHRQVEPRCQQVRDNSTIQLTSLCMFPASILDQLLTKSPSGLSRGSRYQSSHVVAATGTKLWSRESCMSGLHGIASQFSQ